MIGQLHSWSPMGYGFIVTNNRQVYFLHRNAIKEGAEHLEGRPFVRFDVVPPLPGKNFPRAINAIIGVDADGGAL